MFGCLLGIEEEGVVVEEEEKGQGRLAMEVGLLKRVSIAGGSEREDKKRRWDSVRTRGLMTRV